MTCPACMQKLASQPLHPLQPHGRFGRNCVCTLSAVPRPRSRAGKAIHPGVVGSLVSGGSPVAILGLIATSPLIDSARLSAACPTVSRNGTPKPNPLARGSARGGRGAGSAASCAEAEGKPVFFRGTRFCSGGFGCAPDPVAAAEVELGSKPLAGAAAGKTFGGALKAVRACWSAAWFLALCTVSIAALTPLRPGGR